MAEGKTILTILTFCTNYDFCRGGKNPKINCEMVPFSKKMYAIIKSFNFNSLVYTNSLFGEKQEIFVARKKNFSRFAKKLLHQPIKYLQM